MPSNLPPGCSSPDGGLNHAMEAAFDTLCNSIETPECAALLAELAPILELALTSAYHHGRQEGEAEGRQIESERHLR